MILIIEILLAANLTAQRQAVPADEASVAAGATLYRNACAACHGQNLRGAMGPDLFRSRALVSGPPRVLRDLIVQGIPGSEMRAFPFTEAQAGQLIGFLYSQTRPGIGPPMAGDIAAGEAIYKRLGCAECHMIQGKGGVFGPDLSSLALRSFPENIRRSLVDPGAGIAEGFDAVTITTLEGKNVSGVLKNSDNFSLQMMLRSGEYLLLMRSRIRSITPEKRSLMPAAAAKLSPAELRDLMAFLHRQRQPFLKFTSNFQTY